MNFSLFDLLTLLGSLGLFLYGMKVMSDALMDLAGDRMRRILATATANRALAVATGFAITALIQSSSATSLMVISFVNASLLTLGESIGVIMGVNIGTTVTAWLISLLGFKINLGALAIPLAGLGFLLTFSRNKTVKHWGSFIIGFAILFIGLQFLKDAVPDLQSNPEALAFLTRYTSLGMISVLIFILIGTLITIVIQSSSAAMAITIVMCYQGWIPFELAVAMVIGQNIGTTITANLAAIVANYQAKRTARAHLLFNLAGLAWILLLYSPFLHLVDRVAMIFQGGSAYVHAASIPVALSLFHTSFNLINAALLISFIPQIERIVSKMVPRVIEPKTVIEQPHYLDKTSLNYPQTGIKALLDESLRLFEQTVYEVVTHGLRVHRTELESDIKIRKIIKNIHDIELDVDTIYYNKFKNIYSQIVAYATTLQSRFDLEEEKIEAIRSILRADRLMVEMVKDIKPLHANMNRYLNSDNPYIREEYNNLRRMILKLLRLSRQARHAHLEQDYLQRAQKAGDHIDTHDVLINGTIERLVRDHLITPEMATSLMNDSAIAINIARNLVDVSTLLYLQRDTLLDTGAEPEARPENPPVEAVDN